MTECQVIKRKEWLFLVCKAASNIFRVISLRRDWIWVTLRPTTFAHCYLHQSRELRFEMVSNCTRPTDLRELALDVDFWIIWRLEHHCCGSRRGNSHGAIDKSACRQVTFIACLVFWLAVLSERLASVLVTSFIASTLAATSWLFPANIKWLSFKHFHGMLELVYLGFYLHLAIGEFLRMSDTLIDWKTLILAKFVIWLGRLRHLLKHVCSRLRNLKVRGLLRV